jgi:uncharacterized RDD family membrane protein YckC
MGLFDSQPRPGEMLKPQPEAAPPAPRRPFAGFLPRFFALAIDGLIIYAVGGLADTMLRPALLQLNPWLPWLGVLAVFLYFFLGTSPVGRGRTLGLAVLGMHIVDRNGGEPTWQAALKRSLLQMAALQGALTFQSQFYQVWAPAKWQFPALAGMMILTLSGITLLLAMAMAVALHPYKRGWHDIWAGTLVTRDPTPEDFAEALAAPLDPFSERKLAHYWSMTLPFWLVTIVVLAFGPIQSLMRPDTRQVFDDVAALNRGALDGTELKILGVAYPSPAGASYFDQRVREMRLQQGADAPTTATIRQEYPGDGLTIYIPAWQARGMLREDQAESAEFERMIGDLRGEAYARWQAYRDQADRQSPGGVKQPEARRFWIDLIEPLKFGLHNGTRSVGSWIGPADPQAGPLQYRPAPVARPAADDAPTTPTARP